MDVYHKFGSRWFCLQMLDRLNEQCDVFSKIASIKDDKLHELLPLLVGISDTSRAIGLLRQDCLLNEAHVLARLLTERIINLCFLLVAEPSEVEEMAKLAKERATTLDEAKSADELISVAEQWRFVETYDSASLEKKLTVINNRTKIPIKFLRLAVAAHYPIASAALSGSAFGAMCHLMAARNEPRPEDFFQQEFAVLLFSCCSLLHEAITTIAAEKELPNLSAEAERIMHTAADLMKRVKEPVHANVRDTEGWWSGLVDFEYSAQTRLRKPLDAYGKAFTLCAEAGAQLSAIPHAHRGSLRLKVSALFLKRVLNDLRGVWLLLTSGYTSQAASIAASLYENALLVQCIAYHDARASKVAKNPFEELPWSKAQMCRFIVREERKRGEATLPDDEGWKLLYGQYSWLCEIKHPTLHQSIYDAASTAFGESGYAVMTFPDMRDDDLGTKRLICLIVLTTCKGALEAFVRGAGVDQNSEDAKRFEGRMKQVNQIIDEQLSDKGSLRVAFGIRDTKWGKENLGKRTKPLPNLSKAQSDPKRG